ncbi:DEAD/DEAH box helicase [Arthrobacter mobilis]|uniref:DEAD/DEAH box helicase n=1 Tax=Arthrobacter mobilis TaxID=2724944 RepID=UPI00197B6D4D|nr:DEAD/DEAH box helicase [Arthrobacter mobilis]
MPEGLYESLHTESLERRLEQAPEYQANFEKVDPEEAAEILARHIADMVRITLSSAKPEDRLAVANRMLQAIQAGDSIKDGPQQLLSLHAPEKLRGRNLRRPTTALSDSALLTNGKDDPNLAAELRAEMASANTVDLLCAFIRWNGLRLLESALEELKERGARIRVITTTYMGATERRAVDELVRRYGAEVRINYETQSTRLHAKAWLFRRNTGFNTAYVGSSNLSRSALVDGLEWNVRLSSVATPALLNKFQVTFDSYWEQRAFVPYNPDTDWERLDAALERNGGTTAMQPMGETGLEVQPHLHQAEMLEELEAARAVQGHHRNLIVAATGTGKTVLAALDYKRLCDDAGHQLRLLFVAHRKEILEQSLRTYRAVMQSGSFGELYVGEHKPTRWNHVFASVQSLASKGIEQIEPDHFDVVVIDEFHHADAPTYRKIIDHLRPQELLGLTATPERGDGVNVADEFFGGRTASELRLWDALDADLLVPFHYFGLADDVDLSQVEWKRGNYDVEALSILYTGNHARAAKVIKELRDKVLSTREMRAIGFCVSVQHARYMSEVFNRAGITSVAVSGDTNSDDRAAALARLRSKEISCIFAVDLFNEGLDVPEVDTILLLRPTQSSTIFLQQLGRGLRRAEDKAVLTVLDFIGQQRREFRFDPKFRALTGTSRAGLVKQIEDEFPLLPSGCQVILDRVAQQTVLDNIKTQLRFNRKQLVADVRSHAEVLLEDYLRESGRDLTEVYRKTGDSWTSLIREAGLIETGMPSVLREDRSIFEEQLVLKKMTALLHVDDPERAEVYTSLVSPDAPSYENLGERQKILARMLFFTLWPEGGGFEKYDHGFEQLRAYPYACSEISQLMKLGLQAARHMPKGLGQGLNHVPLYSHGTYGPNEVLAALGRKSLERDADRKFILTGGVAWCAPEQTDALFVTIKKDQKRHSITTNYRDYAVSTDLFHWESQNATSPKSPVGRRYLDRKGHGSRIILLTRERAENDFGVTMPFICLGQVDYVQHSGEKPIAIHWKLHRPMPTDIYSDSAAVAR